MRSARTLRDTSGVRPFRNILCHLLTSDRLKYSCQYISTFNSNISTFFHKVSFCVPRTRGAFLSNKVLTTDLSAVSKWRKDLPILLPPRMRSCLGQRQFYLLCDSAYKSNISPKKILSFCFCSRDGLCSLSGRNCILHCFYGCAVDYVSTGCLLYRGSCVAYKACTATVCRESNVGRGHDKGDSLWDDCSSS